MTEQSPSGVGRTAIDAYLDSVEQALIAAHAPRSDRMQVLQDLESQISDMLAEEPSPLTEEMVQAILAKLEAPSHFAATYGNGKDNIETSGGEPLRARSFRLLARPKINWPLVAAFSCGLLAFGCVLLFIALNSRYSNAMVGISLLTLFVGLLLTPIAIWNASTQLRTQPDQLHNRSLVLKSLTVYCVIAPPLLMGFAELFTRGAALVLFGIVAFVYLQYVFIRRMRRNMVDALPKPTPPASDSSHPGTTSTLGGTMSMPAI